MTYELSKFPKVRYTLFESHLFDVLPKNGEPISVADIVAVREQQGDWDAKDKYRQAIIGTMMLRLIKKIAKNKETFRIAKTDKEPGHPTINYRLVPAKKVSK